MTQRIPPQLHRVKTIPVKVSIEEKRIIEDAARRLGQGTGTWLRMLGLEAAARDEMDARTHAKSR
jgi:hypothetical protein